MSEKEVSTIGESGSVERPGMRETFGLNRYHFTRGKIILLVAAGIMVLVGAGLAMVAGDPPAVKSGSGDSSVVTSPGTASGTPTKSTSSSSSLVGNSFTQSGSSFAPSTSNSTTTSEEPPVNDSSTLDDLERALGSGDFSQLFVNGGFGLFAGFAIGFALRAFFRLAMVITGAYLIALIMMSHAGWVEIHWEVIEAQFNGLAANIGEQFESFKTFITGAIPGGGMTAVGLAMGLRQK